MDRSGICTDRQYLDRCDISGIERDVHPLFVERMKVEWILLDIDCLRQNEHSTGMWCCGRV